MESGHYTKHQQVADDVRLVWNNCKAYNQEGSYLYKIAEKLANKFEEKYAKIKNEGASVVLIVAVGLAPCILGGRRPLGQASWQKLTDAALVLFILSPPGQNHAQSRTCPRTRTGE